MNYSTPKEFADYIRKREYQYEQEPEDLETRKKVLEEVYKDHIKEFNYKIHQEFDALNTKYQRVIDEIIEELFEVLPHKITTKFKSHFYFSTVENRNINASIHKAPNNNLFAVLINTSIVSLLTKLGKLEAALVNPECVVFCNRFPENSKLTFDQIKEMREEMLSYFMENRMAHGPFLIINGQESIAHFNKLNIQEKFIIFHEIGHFINGDLFKNSNDQPLSDLFHNISHQREIMADLVGFGLLLHLEKSKCQLTRERRMVLMFSVVHLFDVFYMIQNTETEKYPLPLRRMSSIIEYYYGIELADIIEETYSNKAAFEKLLSNEFQIIESNSDNMEKYIFQSFERVLERLDN